MRPKILLLILVSTAVSNPVPDVATNAEAGEVLNLPNTGISIDSTRSNTGADGQKVGQQSTPTITEAGDQLIKAQNIPIDPGVDDSKSHAQIIDTTVGPQNQATNHNEPDAVAKSKADVAEAKQCTSNNGVSKRDGGSCRIDSVVENAWHLETEKDTRQHTGQVQSPTRPQVVRQNPTYDKSNPQPGDLPWKESKGAPMCPITHPHPLCAQDIPFGKPIQFYIPVITNLKFCM